MQVIRDSKGRRGYISAWPSRSRTLLRAGSFVGEVNFRTKSGVCEAVVDGLHVLPCCVDAIGCIDLFVVAVVLRLDEIGVVDEVPEMANRHEDAQRERVAGYIVHGKSHGRARGEFDRHVDRMKHEVGPTTQWCIRRI